MPRLRTGARRRPSAIRAALLLALAAAAPAAEPPAAGPPAAELRLEQSEGFLVPVTVNGVTLQLRVDPAASGIVIVNPEAAKRARLIPTQMRAPPEFPAKQPRRGYARIGPVSLTGKAGKAVAQIGTANVALQLVWFKNDAIEGADGIISPQHLPYEKVTFVLGDADAAEEPYRVSLSYQLNIGLHHPYAVGGRTVPVQFSLWKPASIGTAAAGAHLASMHDGVWRGRQSQQRIAFGIDRPVRPMALRQPIDLAGFGIGGMLVRTGDHRGDLRLPGEPRQDRDEIVVTGSAPATQRARLQLTIGRERLARCSSLTLDKAASSLVLHCPRQGSAAAGAGWSEAGE